MANLEWRRLADLEGYVVTADQTVRAVALFCHGFGAPGDDLVPLGAQLLNSSPDLLDGVELVFPAGPLSLAEAGYPGGRAWWPLDLERFSRAVDLKYFEEMRQHIPDQLALARAKILAVIDQVLAQTQLPLSRLVIGGFSQGAMLATDVALHLPSPVGGLVIWSGSLLNEKNWKELSPRLQGVPVVQSHGRDDAVLPYESALWLRDLLEEAGADVRFLAFRGGHSISPEAMHAAGQLLEQVAEK